MIKFSALYHNGAQLEHQSLFMLLKCMTMDFPLTYNNHVINHELYISFNNIKSSNTLQSLLKGDDTNSTIRAHT